MQSSILGMGNESLFVTAFSLRKSVQNRKLPSGFSINIQGELQSLLLGSISLFLACTQSPSEGVIVFVGLPDKGAAYKGLLYPHTVKTIMCISHKILCEILVKKFSTFSV